MKKCIKCGQNLMDNQFVCPYCNAPQPNNKYSNNQTYQNNAIPYNAISMSPVIDKTNGWLVFVSVLFPIVGFILSGVKKKTSPKTSKSCLTASIISLVFSLLLGFGFLGCMLLGKVAYNYNEDHPVGGYVFEEKEEEE